MLFETFLTSSPLPINCFGFNLSKMSVLCSLRKSNVPFVLVVLFFGCFCKILTGSVIDLMINSFLRTFSPLEAGFKLMTSFVKPFSLSRRVIIPP